METRWQYCVRFGRPETHPGLTATGTEPGPTATGTEPGPTATETKPGPTATGTKPGTIATRTEPGPTVPGAKTAYYQIKYKNFTNKLFVIII